MNASRVQHHIMTSTYFLAKWFFKSYKIYFKSERNLRYLFFTLPWKLLALLDDDVNDYDDRLNERWYFT